ncbi:MAG: Asp-tRNA(Asn)/Glu-tRNA(Gln) amidotransferase subunit GatC [Oligoflexia bacterium]|nr:Asp-tRNA(Asn)/Glu-tRNA(Gln) amidotransferase subunit GatC [Oligoflexia bacterium]
MSLSEETIKKIADLARLELTPEEHTLYSKQLTAIVDFISQLSKVNTDGVAPLVTPTEMAQSFREDVVGKGFEPGAATSNAPQNSGNLYKVPPVL